MLAAERTAKVRTYITVKGLTAEENKIYYDAVEADYYIGDKAKEPAIDADCDTTLNPHERKARSTIGDKRGT